MKKRMAIIGFMLFLIATSVACSRIKDSTSDNNESTKKVLDSMKSADWEVRSDAISAVLQKPDLLKDKAIAKAVIDLLNKENSEAEYYSPRGDSVTPSGKEHGEAYGEYIIDIIDAAGRSRDPRAIPGLVKSVESGFGVWQSLAQFGDQSVAPLIVELKTSKNIQRRVGCVYALKQILKEKISAESVDKIKNALLEALNDESEFVRDAVQE